MNGRIGLAGFTLVELMFTVAIIGILALIAMVNYNGSTRKAAEALTKGNLGAIRSALSIYYGNNDGIYPVDDLTSITRGNGNLSTVPITRIMPYHLDMTLVTSETSPTETGGWSYNNSSNDPSWGLVAVGCLHQDSRGQVWSSY